MRVLFSLLLLGLLQFHSVDCSLTCGTVECVPGVENLGRGFDLVTGLIKTTNVVDLELTNPSGNYTNPYHGTTYGIPGAVSISNTPSYQIDSLVFRSTTDSLDVGVSFTQEWDEGALALDVDVVSVRETLSQGDLIVSFSREIQSVYTSQLQAFDVLSTVSTFQQDVANLPTEFDPASYQDFIDKYGTHVIQWGLFGGEAVLNSLLDTTVSEEYSDLTVSFAMKLQLEVLKGAVEVSYNKDGYSSDIQTKVSFQNLTFIGGDPAVGATNYSQWVNTVRFNPTFVRSALVNLTSFVSDPVKRKNLKQQINSYILANSQENVKIDRAPLKLSWCNATNAPTPSTCEQLNKVVVGSPLHDDYSEMPYDCAEPCLSWDATNAFVLHDWSSDDVVSSVKTKIKKNKKREWPSKRASDSTTQSCFSPSFKCGTGNCLPGLDLLGIGLDAVTGRRKIIPVAKFTYVNNNSWTHPLTGQQYIFPDQVSVFDDVNQYTSNNIISSQQELADYYAGHFGIKIGVPGVFTFGFETQSSTAVFYSSEALLSITEEDLAFLSLIISSLTPSAALEHSVSKLPTQFHAASYAAFIETYGTHFIEQVTLGGKTVMTNAVDQSFYSYSTDQEMGVQANVMFDGFKAGGTVDSHSSQDFSQYDSSSFSQFNVLGGDDQYYTMSSSTSWSDWEQSLYCDPSTVSEEAQSIVDLVSSIDKTKADNLQQAIDIYLNAAGQKFARNAVGVANQPLTVASTITDSEDKSACAAGAVLLGTESYHKKHSHYYNLNPSRCTNYTWNQEAQQSGRVGPIFLDNCFKATSTTSKHYTGCPANTFATGFDYYKDAHKGVCSKPPILCCSLYFYANTSFTSS